MERSVTLNKNWGWFLLYGIALVILGVIAISAATLTTVISVIFIGSLLLIAGFILLIDTFVSWRHKAGGFIVHLIISLLYLIAGFMLIKTPVVGAASLTLIMAIFYIIVGLFRILDASIFKLPNYGWRIFSGIIALVLGIIIIANWPAASLYIIGLFVGIELLFIGWTYIILSIAAKDQPRL